MTLITGSAIKRNVPELTGDSSATMTEAKKKQPPIILRGLPGLNQLVGWLGRGTHDPAKSTLMAPDVIGNSSKPKSWGRDAFLDS
jgi:hypothetical protein